MRPVFLCRPLEDRLRNSSGHADCLDHGEGVYRQADQLSELGVVLLRPPLAERMGDVVGAERPDLLAASITSKRSPSLLRIVEGVLRGGAGQQRRLDMFVT